MNLKNLITFVLTLVFSEFAFSQNCNYEDYHNRIEIAKTEYKKKNFKQADKLYKIAFESIDFPFGTDLRDALKVAEKTGDKIWMEQMAIELAKGGIPLKFFKHFEKYKWYKPFCDQFTIYQKFFNENFESEFRRDLLEIAKLDYETNNHFHEWRTREFEHSTDTLVAEMTKVSIQFQQMIEEFGFPSEKKIGYYYNKGDVKELPTFVLLAHIYQRGELLYKEQLHDLVCKATLTSSQSKQLQVTQGFGDSTGIVQEMEARKKKFRKN